MIGFQKGPAETGADCICEREDFPGVQFKWRESRLVILQAKRQRSVDQRLWETISVELALGCRIEQEFGFLEDRQMFVRLCRVTRNVLKGISQ